MNYCTPAVAQHTLLLAMMLSEKIAYYDGYVKSGAYSAQERFTPQNEKEKTEESRAGPPLSLYIDSRIFLAAACSMSFFASSLLPHSADTMI